MTLREFVKSFSVYGFLPVFTKFASFLLVPLYIRVFSSAEFGIVELVVSAMGFIVFAINLEFYGAIGRFFFDRESVKDKQVLISTGLGLTFASAAFVSLLCFLFIDNLHGMLFTTGDYYQLLQIGMVWSVLSAVSTYLSVVPRYLKKARQYVLFNAISLVTKLVSTIVFVVVFKFGVAGVLWGNVVGALVSTLLYWFSSSKYIRFVFSVQDAKEIVKFSIPLAPGVMIIGIYQPIFRSVMGRSYSLEELGLFSFASRIAMILGIVETSIRLSWRPLLYENIKKANFGKSYFKISQLVGSLLLVAGTVIIGLSPEIIHLIGTPEYYPSRLMIGGVLIAQIIQNLDSLRGFGFEVAKKTYMVSIITIVSRALGIVFLVFFAKPLGLLGVAIAFMVPLLLSYPIKVLYTKRFISVNTSNIREVGLWVLLIIAYVMSIYSSPLYARILVILACVILATPFQQVMMYLNNWKLLKQTRNVVS
jgi:O-antigen/teichoic acid export membrane protein